METHDFTGGSFKTYGGKEKAAPPGLHQCTGKEICWLASADWKGFGCYLRKTWKAQALGKPLFSFTTSKGIGTSETRFHLDSCSDLYSSLLIVLIDIMPHNLCNHRPDVRCNLYQQA